jgi:hypothetical protein
MPVIHLMGLPGSGKTTLAQHLLQHLEWKHSFRIGTFHKRFPSSAEGGQAAWNAMLAEMAETGWDRFIFESTGVNPRWDKVIERCGRDKIISFKLNCRLPELLRRISLKSPDDQGHGDWQPPSRFRNKAEFVQAVFSEFSRIRAEVIVDTTHGRPPEVFDLVERYIATRV